MSKRPLAVISVFFIIGIVSVRFLPDNITLFHVFVVTLIFIALTLTFSLKGIGRGGFETRPYGSENSARSSLILAPLLHIFLFLSIISLGALLYLNSNIFPPNHISHFLGKDKLKAEIIGTIKGPSEARGVYYGKVRSRYLFEVEAIEVNGEPPYHKGTGHGFTVSGLSQIRIQTEKDYQYGDRLRVKGAIKRPSSDSSRLRPSLRSGLRSKNITRSSLTLAPLLQHSLKSEPKTSFNYKQYLENQNIFAIINASEKNITVLSHDYKSNPILKYAYLVRERLKNMFLEKMPLESGAFLRAILLGDRSELPKKLNESFRNSGTMHILPTQCREKHNYPSASIITL